MNNIAENNTLEICTDKDRLIKLIKENTSIEENQTVDFLNGRDLNTISIIYNYLSLSSDYYEKNELNLTDWPIDELVARRMKHSRDTIYNLLHHQSKSELSYRMAEVYNRKVDRKIISYPLVHMFEYLFKNMDNLKSGNAKQIDFAKKFNISHMQEVKNVAEVLGFNDVLNWSTINLSLNSFEGLITELESLKLDKDTTGNQALLSMSCSLQVENYENMYYAAVALGYKDKLGLSNIKMPTRRILLISDYVKNKYGVPRKMNLEGNVVNLVISEEDIENIYNDNLKHFYKNKNVGFSPKQKSQIKSNIRSLLRSFGYNLEKDENNR